MRILKKNDNTLKKTVYSIFFFFFIFCIVSCRASIQQHGSVIEFDLAKTYPEQEYNLHEIAEVTYLPLESRDDFLVAGTISYLDTEQVIINSSRRDRLFFFDRNTGTALRMLDHQGRSGNEYNSIDAFFCDQSAKEIFILDARKKMVLVYDFDQIYKRSFELPDNCVNMLGYDKSSLLIYIEQDTISKPFLFISKEDGRLLHTLDVTVGTRLNKMRARIGNIDSEASMLGVSASLVSTDDGILISDWACDTLYLLDNQGILAPVAIRKPSAHEMKPCWRLHLKGDNGRFVFFLSTLLPDVVSGTFINSEYRRYVYDRQEHKIVIPRFVLADDPTGAVWNGKRWENQYGKYMLCELKAEDLYVAYREGKLQGSLHEIAAALQEDDNPVLMVVKFNK
jgi:hypothetical protein